MARLSLRCIGNRTAYSTAALVAAVRACMDAFPTLPRGPYRVEFVPAYHSKLHGGRERLGAKGCAHIDAHWHHRRGDVPWLAIMVPPGLDLGAWREVLWTIEHEVGHLIGWRHGPDYGSHDARLAAARKEIPTAPPEWAWNANVHLPPPLRLVKPAPTADTTRADRLLHAEAMLAKAETRVRRAEAVAKRWRRRISALTAAGRRAASRKP